MFPPLRNLRDFSRLLLAGLAGALVFEIYAWLISPVVFGVTLQPANLVVALMEIYAGLSVHYWVGFLGHTAIGVVGFSLIVVLTGQVVRTGWIASGLVAGLLLWFVAQGLLAPAVGRSFMMDFGTYTQSSFVAHVGMTVVIAFALTRIWPDRRDPPLSVQPV